MSRDHRSLILINLTTVNHAHRLTFQTLVSWSGGCLARHLAAACLNELKIVSIELSVLYQFSCKFYIVYHAASACQAKLLYIHRQWPNH